MKRHIWKMIRNDKCSLLGFDIHYPTYAAIWNELAVSDISTSVFNYPGFITVVDEEHSIDEERYISIGLSKNGRLLILAHTDRDRRIRIISARKATKKEERFYENSE